MVSQIEAIAMFFIITDELENGIEPRMMFSFVTDLNRADAISNLLLRRKRKDLQAKESVREAPDGFFIYI